MDGDRWLLPCRMETFKVIYKCGKKDKMTILNYSWNGKWDLTRNFVQYDNDIDSLFAVLQKEKKKKSFQSKNWETKCFEIVWRWCWQFPIRIIDSVEANQKNRVKKPLPSVSHSNDLFTYLEFQMHNTQASQFSVLS